MTTRGLRQIVRFNWPMYMAAVAAAATGGIALRLEPIAARSIVRGALVTAVGLAVFWLAASLAVSWLVYDVSPLMRWHWTRDALGFAPRAWINVHAGLDESTPALQRLFVGATGRVFDIFDPAAMTEASIARAQGPPAASAWSERADFRNLPVPSGTVDAAFLLLSAHELRTDAAREALFADLFRVLAPDGSAIVAEHLRDWANFAAFGPGFLHFHSRRTWLRAFARSSFLIRAEFQVTPFVHVFVLGRRP